jgi:aspartyl-tRNA(Asn)/glutamyl-tRNA(Gln) amidotransferase subunit A
MTSLEEKKAVYELGATEMAMAIGEGELTPLEIAETLLKRINEYDGKVKAFSHLERESVLIEAQALTDEARAGELRGPLHGVPFGVKEQFAVGGVPTLGDWSDPNPKLAKDDATVVARLKAAGALLMGKLYMVGPAGHPPTRNPWNLEYTPGGSSSGSGAAVGSRFLPFAMSEQTGGSGIRPAAYCGISGIKPTYGRNSRYGMFHMVWSTDHACIIGTTIRDVARVFSVTAGYDPKDPTSVMGHEPTAIVMPTRGPRIGVVRNFFPDMTEPEMQAAIEASAQKLAAAGADVVDFMLPADFGSVWANSLFVSSGESSVINMRTEAERAARGLPDPKTTPGDPEPKSKFTGMRRGFGNIIPSSYYLQAQRVRRYLRDAADEAMAEYDAILMATAPGPPPKSPTSSGDWSLLTPWSHLGQPAISIPAGLSAEGLPLGLQFVGPTLSDEKLLGVGAWCQDVLGLLPLPPL